MIKLICVFAGVSAIISAVLVMGLCRLNSSISREEEERELTAQIREYRDEMKKQQKEHE